MLLNEKQIYLNKNFGTKGEVLAFIAEKAYEIGIANDKNILEKELWEREKEYSTAVQELFAIPHSKSENIKESKILIVKLENPIDWESEENLEVKVVFAILVPEKEANLGYLEILTKLATSLLEEEFKEKILEINDKNELLNYIKNNMESD